MNARMFASGLVGEPRSAVRVHEDIDDFRDAVAEFDASAPAAPPRLHDWATEEPLTPTVITVALGQAEQSDLDFVREAARICRRELEARLTERSTR